MQVILPVAVTDSMVTFTSAPAEPAADDPAAWNSGTTYAAGALVHRTTTHRRYRSLLASNINNVPENTRGVWWEEVGGTTRWAMFDQLASSKTTRTTPLDVTVTPGLINAVACLGMTGGTLTITVRNGVTVIYSKAVPLVDGTPVTTWWEYFFASIDQKTDVVLTDIPTLSTSTVQVELTATAGTVSMGSLVFGSTRELGVTLSGVEIGINDYSRKEFDPALGITLLEQRAFSSRLSLKTIVPNGAVDGMVALLKSIRARPVVWIGDEKGRFQSLVLLGFVRDWAKNLDLPDRTYLSIRVEEMT